jgi:hypothetical protein
LLPDWPAFLDDFQRHWPTDADHIPEPELASQHRSTRCRAARRRAVNACSRGKFCRHPAQGPRCSLFGTMSISASTRRCLRRRCQIGLN